MTASREIRADFDDATIVIYQAYGDRIADAALAAGTFVAPFSFGRMTWLKPSLTWLMHRSDRARRPGQERVLAVRITRAGWETALGAAALTTGDPRELARADVHVQWDPERTLRGAPANHYSIQVGVGRGLIRAFAEDWVRDITDLTPRVRKAAGLILRGDTAAARRLLPAERVYPLAPALAKPLGMDADESGIRHLRRGFPARKEGNRPSLCCRDSVTNADGRLTGARST
ncbi:DUF4291 domain-containing protein [Phytomonospora endophytica]|uniref:DUF4291 domain-containing protein n=1 Tax=Phytomonospora endophytica TaxID=714109 RepID=A0A841FR45_9ACTN|nr:DUF4291 domain-containing protein [Phytomonospora endophytica]MBB6036022.1 hypothetical protein [Phytomonospora endophytica]GIG66927.1 hypothetical protein Pen01_32220 [Phytomonospora endophytica]